MGKEAILKEEAEAGDSSIRKAKNKIDLYCTKLFVAALASATILRI